MCSFTLSHLVVLTLVDFLCSSVRHAKVQLRVNVIPHQILASIRWPRCWIICNKNLGAEQNKKPCGYISLQTERFPQTRFPIKKRKPPILVYINLFRGRMKTPVLL